MARASSTDPSSYVRSPRPIYACYYSIECHLTHGRSPVVAVLPNHLRSAGRTLAGYFRGVRLWKCCPKRIERVLVRSIRLRESFSLGSMGAEDDNREMNRFTKMIAALRKRFNTKDTKSRSTTQHTNLVDRHKATRGENDRRLTTRGEARRQQHS